MLGSRCLWLSIPLAGLDGDLALAVLGSRQVEPASAPPRLLASVDRDMSSDLAIRYPAELPITDRHDELLATIEANQVVVVAGETGSGKSTQLPKMCLELGRGTDALIGHTQPRRLAARTIAERIASELGTPLGDIVGYTVRFNDRVGPKTQLKLMTDGILLAEIQRDRSLKRYDTIIIDEAHERSLNIDFILGYLRQLLPRRPDLKVIITSATIDTDRFSKHFDDAPIIEVSGRTYPVELRYQPLEGPDDAEPRDQNEGITTAVEQLWREQPGDILVFCSGEREIREAADAVEDLKLFEAEILPLFARLSAAEQHRVFQNHDRRRVVIATNVAETSVTVPGIRCVVDVGTARISRYSNRTKVQRLPIEEISQASADQRAGRCGRLGPGVCIRLYSEESYDARDEFTEPEIRRTNLASVILQMAALRLGKIEAFPFVDPPDQRSIADGIDLLTELDALDPEHVATKKWLTPIGRELAKLPVDPRYGRMLIEAEHNNCLEDVMVIVAGLSVQDPRERPQDKQQQADESHGRFADPTSDFVSYINLWEHLGRERKARTRNQFRRMCKREYLHYFRVVEWQDVHTQLRQVTRELNFKNGKRRASDNKRLDDPRYREAIHRSILAGLLSHIGLKQTKDQGPKPQRGAKGRSGRQRPDYLGARNAKFAIAPGSALFAESPSWVMAAELVETSRLWGRIAAGIDVAWIEELAEHLATYSYSEPWWDAERGSALAKERVTLFGLTLAANRRIQLGTVDRRLARELFIHHALVEGDWTNDHQFLVKNSELIDDIASMEARARRRDLLVEARAVFSFYDARVPDDIVSAAHFDAWWKDHRLVEPNLLLLATDDVLNTEADDVDDKLFPDGWQIGELDLELAYEFDPSSHLDGLSVLVPVAVLNQLEQETFEWNVPGFRAELIASLIRSMPKAKRRLFIPAAETVEALLPSLDQSRGPLLDVLATELGRRAGTVITVDDFDVSRVPGHVRPTFRVINEDYELLAEGKTLTDLRLQLTEQVRTTLSTITATSNEWERGGLVRWDFGTLPRVVETGTVKAYPALVDEGSTAAIRLQATESEQLEAMWHGTRRLLRLNVAAPVRQLDDRIDDRSKLLLLNAPVQSKAQWYSDAIDAALDDVIAETGGPPWDEAGFDLLATTARVELGERLDRVAEAMAALLASLVEIGPKLDRLARSSHTVSLSDAKAHLARLAYPGFLSGVGLHRVDDVARYLAGIDCRLDAQAKNPRRDLELVAICRRLDNELAVVAQDRGWSDELEATIWMLEELRISLFAQRVGTKGKISEKRVRQALAALRAPVAR